MKPRDLMTQVLAVNLLLVVAAVIAAAFAASPDTNIGDQPRSALVLGMAIGLTILVNVILLQRRFRPLERLVDEMERADLSRPGANLAAGERFGGPEEVERLHRSFRRMLERLEAERRRASSAALAAQEQERARVARDLHDEVNQSLTGLLLRLEAARARAPAELAPELDETKRLANQAMQELLRLARQLRPTALDDLGLKAAIAGAVDEFSLQPEVDAKFTPKGSFTDLPADVQLVLYRVAQEALSNAGRHSGAARIEVQLERGRDSAELIVADDGCGFTFDEANRGLGLGGMRERALLVGGALLVESRPGAGTRIRLEVPIEDADERKPNANDRTTANRDAASLG